MTSKQENEGGVFMNVGSLTKKSRVNKNGMALMFNKPCDLVFHGTQRLIPFFYEKRDPIFPKMLHMA
jgi:hypothetical protein